MTEDTKARIAFVELPARDLRAAKVFYEAVFGWSLTDFGPSYACTLTADVDLGLQGDMVEAPTAPLPGVKGADLAPANAAVLHAGGVVVQPIFAFPGGRRFHFTDPGGMELAIMQVDEAAAP